MKRTRIYTRTGDDGTTGLVGGARIKKNALRIDAYGTVDELSSAIGVARASLPAATGDPVRARRLDAWLAWSQDVLFNLGSSLATPSDAFSGPAVRAEDSAALERAIDEADADLPPLDAFVLPGGSPSGAALHVARTVCRRAERLLVALREAGERIPAHSAIFLNRLSDALFVWSRWIDAGAGAGDWRWNPNSTPPP
ncbi:MAG TPA: cob(I)yrinic acid a,c-diamide adenosyltransferase [Candidatus Tumulicola sp.]|nr:cob(I)yrinic acid a,c-diamide adenosyltransferase [Candidatus Tumulicola sp.]